ncbi:60S ribosomal export protein NMD3 [Paramyrothecium foliicola]|nr:60S ribosomal export protein NMD3 [Paramyrothecium foliicola]
MRVDPCFFCGRSCYPSKGITFMRNDGKAFRFCRSKCHRNFKMKRNPRKLKWTKASRITAGKEMTCDSTLLFGARRNVPERYNRELMDKTLHAMKRVSEIRARRERVFYKKRMAGNRARELAQARKLVAEHSHLLPRLRGSEIKRLAEEKAEAADVDMELDEEETAREQEVPKRKTQVFGGEKRRLKVKVDGDMDILCCNCGAPTNGQTGALCYDCVKLTVDLSRDIQREAVVHFCRDCDRWLLPPASWVVAAPESRELLALCLKKLKGLQKVRLVDASFIWTEPHSRRIKVKLTVQDSIPDVSEILVQQSFEITYMVHTQQCPECAKSFTANVWRACVQVRQKVLHKRTFLFLEQLILKHNAHRDTINIKEVKDGIDFYFAQRNQAEAFVNFLESVVPVEVKASKAIISEDVHTSTKSYKFNYSAQIVPVCKDDLVAIPIKLAKKIGNISPLVLCSRIGTSVNLLDPQTLQTAEVSSKVYWRAPFTSLAQVTDLVEFIVMDIEPITQKGKMTLAEATIAPASNLGVTYFARTHLGGLLHAGDSVLGYMLTGTNFNNDEFNEIEQSNTYGSTIPDVILVKKHYPNRRKNRRRNWRLKRMNKDEGELLPKAADQERMDKEYEMFLRDVEEDEELRAALALYKTQKKPTAADAMSVAETDMTGDDAPQVNMEELLEDLEDLAIRDEKPAGGAPLREESMDETM